MACEDFIMIPVNILVLVETTLDNKTLVGQFDTSAFEYEQYYSFRYDGLAPSEIVATLVADYSIVVLSDLLGVFSFTNKINDVFSEVLCRNMEYEGD